MQENENTMLEDYKISRDIVAQTKVALKMNYAYN